MNVYGHHYIDDRYHYNVTISFRYSCPKEDIESLIESKEFKTFLKDQIKKLIEQNSNRTMVSFKDILFDLYRYMERITNQKRLIVSMPGDSILREIPIEDA